MLNVPSIVLAALAVESTPVKKGRSFRPTRKDLDVNAHLFTHTCLDLQVWLEAQLRTPAGPTPSLIEAPSISKIS
jgi:hypothetical protein